MDCFNDEQYNKFSNEFNQIRDIESTKLHSLKTNETDQETVVIQDAKVDHQSKEDVNTKSAIQTHHPLINREIGLNYIPVYKSKVKTDSFQIESQNNQFIIESNKIDHAVKSVVTNVLKRSKNMCLNDQQVNKPRE